MREQEGRSASTPNCVPASRICKKPPPGVEIHHNVVLRQLERLQARMQELLERKIDKDNAGGGGAR